MGILLGVSYYSRDPIHLRSCVSRLRESPSRKANTASRALQITDNESQTTSEIGEITRWLKIWGEGDERAFEALLPLVYENLRGRAGAYLRGQRPDHTLQPTALVHEAYLQLLGQGQLGWQDRNHFFAIAAVTMRRILVDHARRRNSKKRGGDLVRVSLEDMDLPTNCDSATVLAVDNALSQLEEADQRKARIVELRYFVGFSNEETAEILGCSRATVIRQWRLAKAWLFRELEDAPS